ncbi:MAG: hypothetical protein WCC90_03815 [Methylocella sp.]
MTAMASGASPALPQVLLAHHLRQLKLPTFLREYEKVAAEAAREGLGRREKLVSPRWPQLVAENNSRCNVHRRN